MLFSPQTIHHFTRCRLTGAYRLWSSQTENNLQHFSRPGFCYRCHPPNTFRSGRHHDTTACCGSVPKNPFFHSVQTDWRIQTLVLPNRKSFAVLLPARIFLPMPSPEHVPLWEGPALEEGTARVSGEPSRRKGSANTSPEGRGLRPPARGACP